MLWEEGLPSHGGLLWAARVPRGLRGAARGCRGCKGAARGCTGLQGAEPRSHGAADRGAERAVQQRVLGVLPPSRLLRVPDRNTGVRALVKTVFNEYYYSFVSAR